MGWLDDIKKKIPPPKNLQTFNREQFENFQETYKPVEDAYLDSLSDDTVFSQAANKGKDIANRSMETATGVAGRNLKRYGISSPTLNREITQQRDSSGLLNKIDAINRSRKAADIQRGEDLQGTLSLGREVVNTAGSDLTLAAQMESARKAAEEAEDEADSGGLWGTVGAVVGGIYGGPGGAAAGNYAGSRIGG